MVQVLPYVPGFGERLADSLTQAGGQLAQGYAKRLEGQAAQRAYGILNDPNASPIQKAIAHSQLPESVKKSTSPIFASILGPQAQAQSEMDMVNKYFGGTISAQPYQNFQPMQQFGTQNNQEVAPTQMSPQMEMMQPPDQMASSMQPADRMQPEDMRNPKTWSDQTLDKMAAISGPVGKFAQAEQNRRKQEKKEQFQRQERIESEQGRERAQTSKENRQEIREYAKNYEDITSLENNVYKLNEAEKLIHSRKVSLDDNWIRNAATAILEGHESNLADFIKTDEQQQLFYLLREALAPKEIGGSNPSTREVLIAMQSIPSMYKGQKANEYIIDRMKDIANINLKKARLVEEAKHKGFKNPAEFKSYVENGTKKYADAIRQKKGKELVGERKARPGFVWISDPNGIPREIPENQMEAAEAAGGKRL